MTALGEDHDWTGERVWLEGADYDPELRKALFRLLQPLLPDTTMAFNYEGDRVWVLLSNGADTRAWVNAARAEIGRPALPD